MAFQNNNVIKPVNGISFSSVSNKVIGTGLGIEFDETLIIDALASTGTTLVTASSTGLLATTPMLTELSQFINDVGYITSGSTAGAAGSNNWVQYNESNLLAASSGFTFDPTKQQLKLYRATPGSNAIFVLAPSQTALTPAFEIQESNGVPAFDINVNGPWNVLLGVGAGVSGTTPSSISSSGSSNIAIGYQALISNVFGKFNVAIGNQALTYPANTIIHDSYQNVAIGHSAGYLAAIGINNIIVGYNSHNTSTLGDENILIGANQYAFAGTSGSTLIGTAMNTSLSNIVGLGTDAQNVIIGKTTISADDGNKLQVNGVTQTGSSANGLASFTQTWNTTGIITALKVAITNTASSIGSHLLDLNVNNISLFSINAARGTIQVQDPITTNTNTFGYDVNGTGNYIFQGDGNMGFTNSVRIGSILTPLARLHITSGTTAANTAPIKLTAGNLLTIPETGAIEFDGSHFYGTIGSSRVILDDSFSTVNNGLSISGVTFTLGQPIGTGGDPAQLLHATEIPLNSNNLFFSGTGRIGIGLTTTPQGFLHIAGNPATVPQLYLEDNDGGNTGTISLAANTGMTFDTPDGFMTFIPEIQANQGISSLSTIFLNVSNGVPALRFSSVTLPSSLANGNMEANADKLYYTIGFASSTARKEIALVDSALTLGRVPYVTTNGRLIDSANFTWTNASSTLTITGSQSISVNLGIGQTSPSARLHIAAGTTAANTAPIKLTSGSLLTTPEIGAVEFLTDKAYLTITTATGRTEFALVDVALTSGRVPIVTTNGRLFDSANFTYSSNRLSPTYITLAAGTATAGTAPLVFTSGVVLTAPIAGAMEFVTDTLSLTITTGAARKTVALLESTITGGRILFSSSNSRIADNSNLQWNNSGTAFGIGIGLTALARLHITSGTTTANTAQIKLTAGALLATIEAGTFEYNNALYQSNGALNRLGTGGVIKDFTSDVGNSGSTETDLYTYTTKASTLATTGEKLVAKYSGNIVGSATASRAIAVYFAGTSIFSASSLTVSTSANFAVEVRIICTGATTARATVIVTIDGVSLTSPVTETDLTGLTLTGTNILKITGTSSGTGSASNDILAKMGDIFWYAAANN